MPDNKWARLSAYVIGLANQRLLLQSEYLAAENRILRSHLRRISQYVHISRQQMDMGMARYEAAESWPGSCPVQRAKGGKTRVLPGSSGKAQGMPKFSDISEKCHVLLEARVGIEPTNKGFADLGLTTWLPRPG